MSDLEAQLGVRLLQRTTRKLSLTEVGEAYLRHCQAMRESAQAAADTVAQVQTTPRGTIRVSCPVTLAQTVVAELMPRFLAQYPEVRIDMLVSNRAVNLVEGEVIQIEHLPLYISDKGEVQDSDDVRALSEQIEEAERRAIAQCLRLTKGNKIQTAKLLNISRSNLYEKLAKYQLGD